MRTILVYGDSNSHGTLPLHKLGEMQRYEPQHRWPNIMAAQLGPDWDVVNESLPGRTTVHSDPLVAAERSGLATLLAIAHSHVPLDLVMIMLGTNDLKARFGVHAGEIRQGVSRLVDVAQMFLPGTKIAIIAPVPVAPAGVLQSDFRGAMAAQDGLDDELRALADARACGFFAAGSVAQVSEIDGVHLDAAGQSAIGKRAAQLVQAMFKEGEMT